MNNYNTIAPIYDFLAEYIFGKDILEAQKTYLSEIPENARILIIGGGTGKILKEVLKTQPNCTIDYVEASEKMLEMAQKKMPSNSINFIHGTEDNLTDTYDVIIASFFLDLFLFPKLVSVLQKIESHLTESGILLVTDFYPTTTVRSKTLYFLMKMFFSITTGLKAKKLYNFDDLLQQLFQKEAIQYYNKGFIFSGLYRKLN